MWQFMIKGGPVMWPLLATSIFSLAIILERVFTFALYHQKFDFVVNTLRPLIISNAWDKADKWCQQRGPFTRMAQVWIQQRHRTKEARNELLRREGLIILGDLSNHLRWLAVLAQVSTLLGLLGTFHVMITRLVLSETAGGGMLNVNFSSGVWEAFLTTMVGLMIAIPCAASYQILEDRVDTIVRRMDILVSYLDEWQEQADNQRHGTDDVTEISKISRAGTPLP